MIGIIKFNNTEKGFGFIQVQDGKDIYFKSVDAVGLKAGDIVDFQLKDVKKGQQAFNLTQVGQTASKNTSKPKMININNERIPLNKVLTYEFYDFKVKYIKEIEAYGKVSALRVAASAAVLIASKGQALMSGKSPNKLKWEEVHFKCLGIKMKNGHWRYYYDDRSPDRAIENHRNLEVKYDDDESFDIMRGLEFTDRSIHEISKLLDYHFGVI